MVGFWNLNQIVAAAKTVLLKWHTFFAFVCVNKIKQHVDEILPGFRF